MAEEFIIKHYGTKRHSGRYPWGSGENPQRSRDFRAYVKRFRDNGVSDTDIAKALGMNTTQLRARIQSENAILKLDNISQVKKLKEKGWSDKAIANRLRISERTVANYLKPSASDAAESVIATKEALKKLVEDGSWIDIGPGVEQQLGVSAQKLKNARKQLEEEGYVVYPIYEPQLGMPGKEKQTILILAKPGTDTAEIYKNRINVKLPNDIHSTDGGHTFDLVREVEVVNPKRIAIKYAEDGGTDMDGVIELRRGVKDLDLGGKVYGQVRIAVEGEKYLKGMAMFADDLPDGVDIRFNTNKSKIDKDGNPVGKLDVMKDFEKDIDGKIDLTNPFGATIKAGGQRGALNLVNEEGDWDEWKSKSKLASQFLSKQSPELAKQQLDLAYKIREEQFEEIKSYTNPTIKKDLLKSFSDKMDSDAVHLEGASLPRQSVKVLLPIPSMKENEVYAPSYHDGESLVLIRYPHGGTFELPDVVVNNNNPKAKTLIGASEDAIGVNPKVAAILSGADFDGDTVIAIPNRKGTNQEIKTTNWRRVDPAIQELQSFDAKDFYKVPPSMLYDPKTNPSGFKPMTKKQKGMEMGKVSNLITDMSIQNAPLDEIIRAVKHSMTVIDAEKHKLNWKQSHHDNNITELNLKYQGKKLGGAATLLSKAGAEIRVPKYKEFGIDTETGKRIYIDPKTGKKLRSYTGETMEDWKKDKAGEWILPNGKTKPVKIKTTRMAEAKDAYELVRDRNTPMERIYADYANSLKDLADRARLEMINTPNLEYSKSANKVYDTEARSLANKVRFAYSNKPYERQATLLSNAIYNAKRASHPNLEPDKLKKIRGQALSEARARVGANKKRHQVVITDREWEAIQAGAISNSMLTKILANTDKRALVQRALPKATPVMSSAKITRAKGMISRGYTLADIADLLGVSVSTLNAALK